MDLISYTPKKKFAQQHLLGLAEYTPDEVMQVLSLAMKLKKQLKEGLRPPVLQGKILAMIFAKSSTRTRVSFETGIYQLGGTSQFLSSADIQLGRGEPISDTARVLSRMVDGVMIRTFAQSDVDDLAKYGTIPVINGLTDLLHPCQALADVMTYYEHTGGFGGKMAFVGDGNNVANSLMMACAKTGIDFAIACPEGFEPDAQVTAQAQAAAQQTGAMITISRSAEEAAQGASAVYTDVWTSMGQEAQAGEKHAVLQGYQVNEALMAAAQPDAIFLHCLPAHRGEEVTAGVIDGLQSAVWDEAENRLHAQKAVMALLMGGAGV